MQTKVLQFPRTARTHSTVGADLPATTENVVDLGAWKVRAKSQIARVSTDVLSFSPTAA